MQTSVGGDLLDMGKDMVLISSCLLGVRCRYDAKIVEGTCKSMGVDVK